MKPHTNLTNEHIEVTIRRQVPFQYRICPIHKGDLPLRGTSTETVLHRIFTQVDHRHPTHTITITPHTHLLTDTGHQGQGPVSFRQLLMGMDLCQVVDPPDLTPHHQVCTIITLVAEDPAVEGTIIVGEGIAVIKGVITNRPSRHYQDHLICRRNRCYRRVVAIPKDPYLEVGIEAEVVRMFS